MHEQRTKMRACAHIASASYYSYCEPSRDERRCTYLLAGLRGKEEEITRDVAMELRLVFEDRDGHSGKLHL